MVNVIIELSRYLLIILLAMYTFWGYTVFQKKEEKKKRKIFFRQRILILLIQFVAYMDLYLATQKERILPFYIAQLVFTAAVIIVYQLAYKTLSRLVLNHMLLLMSIGFVMLVRLNFSEGIRQFIFTAVSMGICVVVPFIIDKFSYLSRFGYLYAVAGLVLLAAAAVFGKEIYGAKNWINIAGIPLQPSEFVKILFVLFAASLLSRSTEFKQVVLVSITAGLHVILLVLEKDLGAALIFFITYLFMLYTATSQPLYLGAGFLCGGGAAFVAYRLFAHVRVRVLAWSDPWSNIDDKGYQICQSLFAIGTGGFFGMGLGKGLPESIPVVESDFIFSAIAEEFGGIFSIFILLIYVSCFMMFINIAMRMQNMFYKLTATGFSILFIFQVFLSVGGVTKFIPSTGVTLPLLSQGGSSVVSTVLIFSIIQGLYVRNQEEIEMGETA